MTDPDQLSALPLDELRDYHDKQATHFEPFGAQNTLTIFHRRASTAIATERARADALRAEVTQLRVQLAGCGVAAMGNTRESWARNNEVTQGVYGWSASYADCLAAAKREIDHRERADALEAALRAIVSYNDTMSDDGDWALLIADARALLEKKA